MINLTQVLALGRTRTVYQHPSAADWLIKIENRHTLAAVGKISLFLRGLMHRIFPFFSENARELRIYKKLASSLKEFIPEYEEQLVITDKGLGLACRQVLDDNSDLSKTLGDYLRGTEASPETLKPQLERFFQTLLLKKLYFFDFNLNNFLIQIHDGQPTLRFIDLKGYRKDRSVLPISYLSSFLAERKMKRRIERLYKRIML
jgi:hypothetical protein